MELLLILKIIIGLGILVGFLCNPSKPRYY